MIDTGIMRQRRLTRSDVAVRRSLGRYRSTGAPERTQDRTAAVVEGLLTHWLTRPDNLSLRLAGVRDHATRLRTELGTQVRRRQERLAEAAAELEHLQRRAAVAADLAAMPPAA